MKFFTGTQDVDLRGRVYAAPSKPHQRAFIIKRAIDLGAQHLELNWSINEFDSYFLQIILNHCRSLFAGRIAEIGNERYFEGGTLSIPQNAGTVPIGYSNFGQQL